MKLKSLLAVSLLATVATAVVAGPYEAAMQKALNARAKADETVKLYTSMSPIEQFVYKKMLEAPNYRSLTPEGKVKVFVENVIPALEKSPLYTKDSSPMTNGKDSDIKQLVKDYKVEDGKPVSDEQHQKHLQLVDRLALADALFFEDIPAYEAAVKEYKNLVQNKSVLFGGTEQELHAHLVQSTLSYNLLKTLNASGWNRGFVAEQGAYSRGGETSVWTNQLHLGYKLKAGDYSSVGGFVTTGLENSKFTATAQSQHRAVDLGLGLYATTGTDKLRLSGLFQAYSTNNKVDNSFSADVESDYKKLLSQIIKINDNNPLKNEVFTDTVNLNKGVLSFVAKAEYLFQVNDKFNVTPALFYQAQKTSAQDEVTVGHALLSIPAMMTHQVGGALAADYRVNDKFTLGGDVAVSYLRTAAGTHQYQAKVLDWKAPDNALFLQSTYKVETREVANVLTNYRVATQVKASYTVTPNITVAGKAGFSYFTHTKAQTATYGVDLNLKF